MLPLTKAGYPEYILCGLQTDADRGKTGLYIHSNSTKVRMKMGCWMSYKVYTVSRIWVFLGVTKAKSVRILKCKTKSVLNSRYIHQWFTLQFQITTNKMQCFLIYLFLQTLYVFQAVRPPIIRST